MAKKKRMNDLERFLCAAHDGVHPCSIFIDDIDREELKPCPRCGGKPMWIYPDYTLACYGCGLDKHDDPKAVRVTGRNPLEAAKKWNNFDPHPYMCPYCGSSDKLTCAGGTTKQSKDVQFACVCDNCKHRGPLAESPFAALQGFWDEALSK